MRGRTVALHTLWGSYYPAARRNQQTSNQIKTKQHKIREKHTKSQGISLRQPSANSAIKGLPG
jgi:hypothetical protein